MGTVNSGLFTSTSDDWPTPQALFDALNREFGFTLDCCASNSNAKCERYYTKEDDGLSKDWSGTVWMNPPYGRGIGKWMRKAFESSILGSTVVCLIPSRTDTAYWHDYAMKAEEIRFIRGRLHFIGDRHAGRIASGETVAHNAPFPSAVIVFRSFSNRVRAISSGRDGIEL